MTDNSEALAVLGAAEVLADVMEQDMAIVLQPSGLLTTEPLARAEQRGVQIIERVRHLSEDER